MKNDLDLSQNVVNSLDRPYPRKNYEDPLITVGLISTRNPESFENLGIFGVWNMILIPPKI